MEALGKFKTTVRTLIAIYRTGRGGTSNNFDINVSCDKPIPQKNAVVAAFGYVG